MLTFACVWSLCTMCWYGAREQSRRPERGYKIPTELFKKTSASEKAANEPIATETTAVNAEQSSSTVATTPEKVDEVVVVALKKGWSSCWAIALQKIKMDVEKKKMDVENIVATEPIAKEEKTKEESQ